jgi:hypothetical protein
VMDVIALITIRPKGRMYIHCINMPITKISQSF